MRFGAANKMRSGSVISWLIGLPTIVATASFQMKKAIPRASLAEQKSDWPGHHDSLTGLLNRRGLAREVGRRAATGERLALLYLDLDRFRTVNETFGHQAGDELLKAVAERLRNVSRPQDAIARIGGDEFVILAAVPNRAAAQEAGERFAQAIGNEHFFSHQEAAFVGASVGVALCPDHGCELGPLLGEADAALYQAKYSGRGLCIVARTGTRPAPIDDQRPQPHAPAQRRLLQGDAAA